MTSSRFAGRGKENGMMNGIICIDKPEGYTSFDVVARLRGMSKTKRVGHSGTLDPMATGVLPVFIGNATKACDLAPNNDKRYTARFLLGQTTDTLDSTGSLLTQQESRCTQAELEAVLPEFTGRIEQLPPMYSAVRVNGQRLYDIARAGGEVERKPRPVTVYSLKLLEFSEGEQSGVLDVACSKGTYIRTLIDDIGHRLSVGGIMTGLIRTEACGFSLEDCITIEAAQELTAAGELEGRLLPVDRLFEGYPPVKLPAVQARMFQNGVRLDLTRIRCDSEADIWRIYDDNGTFLGLASPQRAENVLKIKKLFL